MDEENFFYYLKFNGFSQKQESRLIIANYRLQRGSGEDLQLTAAIDPEKRLARWTAPSRTLIREQCSASFQRMIMDSFADPGNPVFAHARQWQSRQN